MKVNRSSAKYEDEVVEFLQFTERNRPYNNGIFIALYFYGSTKKHRKKQILSSLL